jgi:hypothetical protein
MVMSGERHDPGNCAYVHVGLGASPAFGALMIMHVVVAACLVAAYRFFLPVRDA